MSPIPNTIQDNKYNDNQKFPNQNQPSMNKNILINAAFTAASGYCAYRGVKEQSIKWTSLSVGLSIIAIIAANFSVDYPSREQSALLRRIKNGKNL